MSAAAQRYSDDPKLQRAFDAGQAHVRRTEREPLFQSLERMNKIVEQLLGMPPDPVSLEFPGGTSEVQAKQTEAPKVVSVEVGSAVYAQKELDRWFPQTVEVRTFARTMLIDILILAFSAGFSHAKESLCPAEENIK